jgi:hypothetical protein
VREETGARVRPGPDGGPLSAVTAGSVSFVAMLIPGPVIAPGITAAQRPFRAAAAAAAR